MITKSELRQAIVDAIGEAAEEFRCCNCYEDAAADRIMSILATAAQAPEPSEETYKYITADTPMDEIKRLITNSISIGR